jgi:hypothetical protein
VDECSKRRRCKSRPECIDGCERCTFRELKNIFIFHAYE